MPKMAVVLSLLAGLSLPVVGWGAPSAEDKTVAAFMERAVGLGPEARAGLGKKGIACFADKIAGRVSRQEMTALIEVGGARPSLEVTSAVIEVIFDCALIGRMIAMAGFGGHHLSGKTIRCLDERAAQERQILTSAFSLVVAHQPTTPEMDAARASMLADCMSEKELAAMMGE